jgi:hypothetical protein
MFASRMRRKRLPFARFRHLRGLGARECNATKCSAGVPAGDRGHTLAVTGTEEDRVDE